MPKVNIPKAVAKMLPRYLENRQGELKTISEALEKDDYLLIQSIGHKLKGNAGIYGLDELGSLGADLERAARKRDMEKIKQVLAAISSYLQSLDIYFSD